MNFACEERPPPVINREALETSTQRDQHANIEPKAESLGGLSLFENSDKQNDFQN